MTKIRQLNSASELQAEKKRLLELSKMRKARLNDRVDYFMQNSGSILLSTVSYHFILKQLPIIGDFIAQREKESPSSGMAYPAALRPSDPLTSGQKVSSLFSVVWKVAQPLVLSAIFKRVGRLFEKKK